jgi:hypothetical protein
MPRRGIFTTNMVLRKTSDKTTGNIFTRRRKWIPLISSTSLQEELGLIGKECVSVEAICTDNTITGTITRTDRII